MVARAGSQGPRLTRAGRAITIWSAIAVAAFGQAVAGSADLRLPMLRPAPLSDFYGTLRRMGENDTISESTASLRAAGARLALLTEQLPESLPLQTPAKTVLIVHRKNPKYRDTIHRLLWRRLDPALSAIATPSELPSVFDQIATELRPLCGARADTVRASLDGLYKSDYGSFLATAWPSRERVARDWIRSLTETLQPHERKLLNDLGNLLAVPIPDTTRVRILVVTVTPPPPASTPIVRDGHVTIVVSTQSASGHVAALDLLCGYMRACDALAPPGQPSALRVLAESLSGVRSLHPTQELQRSLLRYAVSKALAKAGGWEEIVSLPADPTLAASYKKNWDAYAAGGISLSSACAAIASDASVGGK